MGRPLPNPPKNTVSARSGGAGSPSLLPGGGLHTATRAESRPRSEGVRPCAVGAGFAAVSSLCRPLPDPDGSDANVIAQQPARHLRDFSWSLQRLRCSQGQDVGNSDRIMEGWLDALRRDVAEDIDATVRQELELVRKAVEENTRLNQDTSAAVTGGFEVMGKAVEENITGGFEGMAAQLSHASVDVTKPPPEPATPVPSRRPSLEAKSDECRGTLAGMQGCLDKTERAVLELRHRLGSGGGAELASVQVHRDFTDLDKLVMESRQSLVSLRMCMDQVLTDVDTRGPIQQLSEVHKALDRQRRELSKTVQTCQAELVQCVHNSQEKLRDDVLRAFRQEYSQPHKVLDQDFEPVFECVRTNRTLMEQAVLAAMAMPRTSEVHEVDQLRQELVDHRDRLAEFVRECRADIQGGTSSVLAAVQARERDFEPVLECIRTNRTLMEQAVLAAVNKTALRPPEATDFDLLRHEILDQRNRFAEFTRECRANIQDGTSSVLKTLQTRELSPSRTAAQSVSEVTTRRLVEQVPELTAKALGADFDFVALRREIGDQRASLVQAVRECRADVKDCAAAVLQAVETMDAKGPNWHPVLECVRANRTIVDHTPVLNAIAKSAVPASDMLATVLQQHWRLEMPSILSAIRETRSEMATVHDLRAELAPLVAGLREQGGAWPQRPVDLRPILESMRETRYADLSVVLEAVERLGRSTRLEAMPREAPSTVSAFVSGPSPPP